MHQRSLDFVADVVGAVVAVFGIAVVDVGMGWSLPRAATVGATRSVQRRTICDDCIFYLVK